MAERKCWIDGCAVLSSSWGMCEGHREMWEALVRVKRTRLVGVTDQEKYEYYVIRGASAEVQQIFGAKPDCWIWGAGLTSYGYGSFVSSWYRTGGGSDRVHLYVLTQMLGLELNPEEETDHRCRFRPCSNPDHLERTSQKVNTLRGVGFSAENYRKTHCDSGHEFTPENTLIDKNNWRRCAECSRLASAEYSSRPEVKQRRVENTIPSTGVRGKGQYQAERDRCSDGHKLEGDNLIQEKRTRNGVVSYVRRCRICVNAKSQRNHAKRVEEGRKVDGLDLSSDRYVDRGGVAEILGIERSYVNTYARRQKDFPAYVKSGRSVYYDRQEVINWRNTHTHN